MSYRKYRNKKTVIDGITFDSKHEAERYIVLKAMQKRGEISDLVLQKKFVVIRSQRAPDTVDARGRKVKGKVIEKEASYYADFVYYDNSKEEFVVEDAKGVKTEAYKLKKKLMLLNYGIKIKEV